MVEATIRDVAPIERLVALLSGADVGPAEELHSTELVVRRTTDPEAASP